LFKISEL